MNRRGFLGLLGAAAVVPLVPMPELDLGRRIFLPPAGGWRVVSGINALDLDEFRRRFLEPAMRALVASIEADCLRMASQLGAAPTLELARQPLLEESNDGGRTFEVVSAYHRRPPSGE